MGKYDKPIGESGIEWTNRTWNPATGCTKISAGCKHCYAETLAKRLQAMRNPRYVDRGFQPTMQADKVAEPLGWRTPEWVFVNSMSDLLHRDFPDSFVLSVFDTMGRRANWHRYQVLTKRADRWPEISARVVDLLGSWPRNVLPGVSVENRKARERIDFLGQVGDEHTVRMLSVEPLLEGLLDESGVQGLADQLRRNRIGWVITGGEAGWNARPAVEQWFREVRDACDMAGVAFFHKQFGGVGTTHEAKRGGTLAVLDGVLHHAMPEVWHADPPGKARGHQASLLAASS